MRRELLMNRPSYRGCCELPTIKAALIVTYAIGIYGDLLQMTVAHPRFVVTGVTAPSVTDCRYVE